MNSKIANAVMAHDRGKELSLRVISAAVLAPLALSAVWFGGWAFTGFITLIAATMGWEWGTVCSRNRVDWRRWFLLATSALTVIAGYLSSNYSVTLLLLAGPAGLLWFMAWRQLKSLEQTGQEQDIASHQPAVRWDQFWWFMGPFYCGAGPAMMVYLRDDRGMLPVIVWLLTVTWANDIAAFFIGRALRGPKLSPRISPGKTWSGAFGGIAGAVLAGCIMVLSWRIVTEADLSATGFSEWWRYFQWHNIIIVALLSLGVAIAAQAGDLFESGLKRHFAVKDSGHLIPGHGGVLDRVDALVGAVMIFTLLFLGWEWAAYGHIGGEW